MLAPIRLKAYAPTLGVLPAHLPYRRLELLDDLADDLGHGFDRIDAAGDLAGPGMEASMSPPK